MENRTSITIFLLNQPSIQENSQNEHLSQFLVKSDEKVVYEKNLSAET